MHQMLEKEAFNGSIKVAKKRHINQSSECWVQKPSHNVKTLNTGIKTTTTNFTFWVVMFWLLIKNAPV